MIERIEQRGRIFALVLRKELEPEATDFYTSRDSSLQLGIIKHEQGYAEKPHIHRRSEKVIHDVPETLHIEYGKVQVNFYAEDGKKVDSTVLNEGDTILLLDGGHAIKVIEKFKGIKVKQGPYVSLEEDKEFLETKE